MRKRKKVVQKTKEERKYDCLKYSDCLMKAALMNKQELWCNLCSLYEKGFIQTEILFEGGVARNITS